MRYRCVYTVETCVDGRVHHLNVDADDVPGAIEALKAQLLRQSDTLATVVAVYPPTQVRKWPD
jgi:hypothetical protein